MPKNVTIKDVARKAGVAISTVSLAFSAPDRVNQSTRQKIEDAATTLGYRRNILAGSLRKGSAPVIGLLLHDVTNPFYSDILRHIEQRAMEKGYVTLLSNSWGNPDNEVRALASMNAMRCAGFIIHSVTGSSDLRQTLNAMTTPTVAFDQPIESDMIDFVGSKNHEAAQMLTRHLIDQGHRRIAFLGGITGTETAEQRRLGFLDAMHTAGLKTEDHLIVDASYDMETAMGVTRRWMTESPSRPTAIVSANNFMASGALMALQHLDLSCPEDISIVCFDRLPWATATNPQLTLAHQQVEQIATATLDLLLSRISGEYTGKQRTQRFPFAMEIGTSCRPV